MFSLGPALQAGPSFFLLRRATFSNESAQPRSFKLPGTPSDSELSLCDTARVHADGFLQGIELFNAAEFFEAHEVLEDVWRAAPEPERKFLQGLIQVAVALHHHSRGNVVGCRSLLGRASRNLSAYPERYRGIDLAALLKALNRWSEALEQGQPLPPVPRLETHPL
jgi:uncharacterized protein